MNSAGTIASLILAGTIASLILARLLEDTRGDPRGPLVLMRMRAGGMLLDVNPI